MRKISEEEARKGGFIKDLDTGKIYFVGFKKLERYKMVNYVIGVISSTHGLQVRWNCVGGEGENGLKFARFYEDAELGASGPVQLEHAEWFPADEYDIELVKRSEV